MIRYSSDDVDFCTNLISSADYTRLDGRKPHFNDLSVTERYELWKSLDDSRKQYEKLEKEETLKSVQERNKDLRGRIVDVKFSGNRTIVFFRDGTKTIVKCQEGDTFDKEKGLAMACMKRLFKDTNVFNDVLRKWCND